MYAAISSLSLSLLATGIDSIFDIGSNVLLFWLHKKAKHMDSNRWPVGGARLETIGNIVYGAWLPSVTETSIVMAMQASCMCFLPGKLLPLQYSTNSMGSVNLVVIVESARSLITKTNDDLQEFHIPSIIAVAAALGQ